MQQNNITPHNLSWKGYNFLEKKNMMEKKEKRYK